MGRRGHSCYRHGPRELRYRARYREAPLRCILKETYADNKLSDGTHTAYGLGWHVQNDKSGRFWAEHSGGATGGAAYLLRAPVDGLAIAILCNLERPGELKKLAHDLAKIVLP